MKKYPMTSKKTSMKLPQVAAIQPPAWRSPLQQGALGAAPVQRTIRGGLSASASGPWSHELQPGMVVSWEINGEIFLDFFLG